MFARDRFPRIGGMMWLGVAAGALSCALTAASCVKRATRQEKSSATSGGSPEAKKPRAEDGSSTAFSANTKTPHPRGGEKNEIALAGAEELSTIDGLDYRLREGEAEPFSSESVKLPPASPLAPGRAELLLARLP